ncbi:hypothetical membrane protein [Candidatus Protochlamydia naegleriophila]|uniref:Hypothetical membrane protein n=1 Tax=Candidatus Protochlamydia naegleriophila TaxID=389348 RepID=A0A0U5JD35_9BACT|nr:hypothetical membrane protein [Candidatus Protochlamydia naegleriophila]
MLKSKYTFTISHTLLPIPPLFLTPSRFFLIEYKDILKVGFTVLFLVNYLFLIKKF